MNEQEKILSAMEKEKIWRYSEIEAAAGISPSMMARTMPRLTKSGKITKRTDGKTAYYALRKYADDLHRKIELDTMPEEYKAFIGHSKRYDQCFAKYMSRREIKAANEKKKSIARLMKPQGMVWTMEAA